MRRSILSLATGLTHRLRALSWRLFRPTTVGVRALVLDERGRVLLVRHTYTNGWFLPGGGVGRGESVGAALRRELEEEVGLELTDAPRLLGIYSSTAEGKSDHIGVFVVERWRRQPKTSAEITETDFFDPAALPADVSAGTRRRVGELLGLRSINYAW
jgi:8-oxo-dGTP pyrophosphatase MutT (NUDIX family)